MNPGPMDVVAMRNIAPRMAARLDPVSFVRFWASLWVATSGDVVESLLTADEPLPGVGSGLGVFMIDLVTTLCASWMRTGCRASPFGK